MNFISKIFYNSDEVEALTFELENQSMEAESHIEAERCKTEELESKIKELQDRMVRGGVGVTEEKDIINNLNQSQIILEQRNLEISERKKREVYHYFERLFKYFFENW